jgi:hypothetical protein
MGKSTISIVIFNSYVKLPEGIYFNGLVMIYPLSFFAPINDHNLPSEMRHFPISLWFKAPKFGQVAGLRVPERL